MIMFSPTVKDCQRPPGPKVAEFELTNLNVVDNMAMVRPGPLGRKSKAEACEKCGVCPHATAAEKRVAKGSGDFTDCMTRIVPSAKPDDPEAFCAWYEHEQTGSWPGEKAKSEMFSPVEKDDVPAPFPWDKAGRPFRAAKAGDDPESTIRGGDPGRHTFNDKRTAKKSETFSPTTKIGWTDAARAAAAAARAAHSASETARALVHRLPGADLGSGWQRGLGSERLSGKPRPIASRKRMASIL